MIGFATDRNILNEYPFEEEEYVEEKREASAKPPALVHRVSRFAGVYGRVWSPAKDSTWGAGSPKRLIRSLSPLQGSQRSVEVLRPVDNDTLNPSVAWVWVESY